MKLYPDIWKGKNTYLQYIPTTNLLEYFLYDGLVDLTLNLNNSDPFNP